MYGSVSGAQAYVRHMTLDGANFPTTSDMEEWLTAQSAQLTAWIAEAGYVTPVTTETPDALAVLDNYANLGAAGLAELSMRSSGATPDSDDVRENAFLQRFAAAEKWIKSGSLAALGVPQMQIGSRAQQPVIGQIGAGAAHRTWPRDMP